MSKKVSNILGIIVSIFIIILGVVILSGGFTGDNYYSSPSNYNYDFGYATFGADFYNYVSNNAAYAAYNTARVAAKVADLIDLLESVFGFAFIGAGLIGICKFGTKEEKAVKFFNGGIGNPSEEPVPEEPVPEEEIPEL